MRVATEKKGQQRHLPLIKKFYVQNTDDPIYERKITFVSKTIPNRNISTINVTKIISYQYQSFHQHKNTDKQNAHH